MIPFYLILGLNAVNLLMFLAIQTAFNFVFFNILLFVGVNLLLKDKSQLDKKKIIKTSIIAEASNSIISVLIYFFVNFSLPALILYLFLYFSTPFIVIYLLHYEKDKFTETKTLLLYVISYPGAFAMSVALTSVFLSMIGIPHYFLIGS